MNLIENYTKALDALYEHVGFKEDWVVYPIDECLDSYWYTNENNYVRYANTLEKLDSDGDYYEDEIYTQRFYSKWIYEGADYTMIFCNPGVDGMKWFRVFDNTKRLLDADMDDIPQYIRKMKLKQINNLVTNKI